MKSVLFLKNAEAEFYDSIRYYNEERPGLGYEFAVQVEASIRRIIQFPDAWPVLAKEARRCVVSRFPFCLLYLNEDTQIVIVAVMHAKRRPGYWEKRIK